MLRKVKGMGAAVGDLVFPRVCWAEGSGEAVAGLSEEMRVAIGRLAERAYCRRCGLSTGAFAGNDFLNPCGRCGERDIGVKHFARVGVFAEPLVGLVHRMKFGRSWEVARVVAPFLYQGILRVSEEMGTRVDCLVPAPLHWMRHAERGFNQAEELAREVGKLSGWGVELGMKRVKRTMEQARVKSRTERAENLRGAFVCNAGGRLAGKHVWLVDDVSTTGATLRAMVRAIHRMPRGDWPASVNAGVLCVTDRGDRVG